MSTPSERTGAQAAAAQHAAAFFMTAAAIAIFCFTYVLIAAHRLHWLPIGRPAGALLGAVLMVAVGVLTPRESYAAVDHGTIVLLFGMMMLTAYLREARFFRWVARGVLSAAGTPWRLLCAVAVLSGVLSAWLVNDTVCLFLTPVVVGLCSRAGLPLGPYLLALATSANIGSAATIVGNPQNMIVGSLSRLPFTEFFLCVGPAAALALSVNVALLGLYYRHRLPAAFAPSFEPPLEVDPARLGLVGAVTAGIVAGFFAGLHLGYTTLAGVAVLVLVDRKDMRKAFVDVDWPLLVFFASLFVVVAGLAKTGLADQAFRSAAPHLDLGTAEGVTLFSGLMVLGSNVFSNVPMVVLAGPHLADLGSEPLGWMLLAFTTTIAGNLTLLGSVANIIVAEGAREHHALGFFEYLRFGVVSTVAALAVGVPVVWGMAHWLYG